MFKNNISIGNILIPYSALHIRKLGATRYYAKPYQFPIRLVRVLSQAAAADNVSGDAQSGLDTEYKHV